METEWPESVRADLAALRRAQSARLDAQRPAAVARQRARGRLTVREIIDVLIDADSFVEHGGLAQFVGVEIAVAS